MLLAAMVFAKYMLSSLYVQVLLDHVLCVACTGAQCTIVLQPLEIYHHPLCLQELLGWQDGFSQDTHANRLAAAAAALPAQARAAMADAHSPKRMPIPLLQVEVGRRQARPVSYPVWFMSSVMLYLAATMQHAHEVLCKVAQYACQNGLDHRPEHRGHDTLPTA